MANVTLTTIAVGDARDIEPIMGNFNAIATVINGNIDSTNLAADSVGTSELQTDAVQTENIKDLNVTTGKLADTAVTTAKITDANVTTAKIADLNVTVGKLAGDITLNKLDQTITRAYLTASSAQTGVHRLDLMKTSVWRKSYAHRVAITVSIAAEYDGASAVGTTYWGARYTSADDALLSDATYDANPTNTLFTRRANIVPNGDNVIEHTHIMACDADTDYYFRGWVRSGTTFTYHGRSDDFDNRCMITIIELPAA